MANNAGIKTGLIAIQVNFTNYKIWNSHDGWACSASYIFSFTAPLIDGNCHVSDV